MKRIVFIAVLSQLVILNLTAQDRLNADTSKTQLTWLGEKVMGQHTGTIKLKSGWIVMKENKIVSGEFNIDMKSIRNSDGQTSLDTHLMSDDFFSSNTYPVSKLVITGSSSFETGTGVVKGLMTIKGVTNPIEFKASTQKNNDGLWFYANITIDRTKYNVRYGSGTFFSNLGDKIIYDEFKIKINLLMK
jgi:polyisoprenoid-binding protein YceI